MFYDFKTEQNGRGGRKPAPYVFTTLKQKNRRGAYGGLYFFETKPRRAISAMEIGATNQVLGRLRNRAGG